MDLEGSSSLLFDVWRIVMLHSTETAKDWFGEAGRGGHQLLQGMEHVHRSSHALFITSSFHCKQLEEVVSIVQATLVFMFRRLKQAQASTAPTLSILQPNVGQTAALLKPLCLFSLKNRNHATRKSFTEDTHVHSCWKMKLQVGECLISRTMLLNPARYMCVRAASVKGGCWRGSSLECYLNDPFQCHTLFSSNYEDALFSFTMFPSFTLAFF